MKPIISPSILSADFGYLARDIEMINESEAEWVHIDIMDGVFVPNISFGFPVLKYVAKLSQKPLDVHLMIVQPENMSRMCITRLVRICTAWCSKSAKQGCSRR